MMGMTSSEGGANSAMEVSTAAAPVKRGRGRPRKNGSLKSLCNSIHVLSNSPRPRGRGRGRPKLSMDEYRRRKAINKYIYGITETNYEEIFEDAEEKTEDAKDTPENNNVLQENANNSTEEVVGKKRGPGRPRIHPPKIKVPGRGRGRPPKNSHIHSQQFDSPNGGLVTPVTPSSTIKVNPLVKTPTQSPFKEQHSPMKRGRGRPRIHPPKIKVPGRGRGRPKRVSLPPGEKQYELGEINIDGILSQTTFYDNSSSNQFDDHHSYSQGFMRSDNSSTSPGSCTAAGTSGTDSLKPFPKKPRIKGLLRVTSLPGRRPKPAGFAPSYHPSTASPSVDRSEHAPVYTPTVSPLAGASVRRGRGRPRIHPPKLRIPGRGRGRPPKSPEEKAQTVRARLIRKAIETSNHRKPRRMIRDILKSKEEAHSPHDDTPQSSGSDVQQTSSVTGTEDNSAYPTLAIRMVGSLQPLFPHCDGPHILSANPVSQESKLSAAGNESKSDAAVKDVWMTSQHHQPLHYYQSTEAESHIANSVDELSLQHVNPAPIIIQPDSDNFNTQQHALSSKVENLLMENEAYANKVQRLTDVVEVKNTAIEHLKGIVESLGIEVSPFVIDALNATAVKDEDHDKVTKETDPSAVEVCSVPNNATD